MSANPPPRTEAAMVWDPIRNKVVLFGGTFNGQYRQHLPQLIGASLYAQGATINAAYPCLPGVGLGVSNAGQLILGSY